MFTKYIYTLVLLLFLTSNANAQNSTLSIIKGKYSSSNEITRLTTFTASKGDNIEIKLTTLHNRRGLNIWVKQHPGNLTILDFEDLTTSSKIITAHADAIFQIYYGGGSKLDFEIEVTNTTNKPNGPNKGKVVYVQIPDTLHASGSVNRPFGERYALTPYKEKVILKTFQQAEQICNRNFFTGVDKLELNIPGTTIDEYRTQTLKSYNVTLICGESSMQNALVGVVDAGIDAGVHLPSLSKNKSKNKGNIDKASSKNQYTFTENLDAESSKLETFTEAIEIAQNGAELLSNNPNSDLLETTAFIVDGGIKEVILENALDAAGASKEVKAIIGEIESFPSISELTKNAVHSITPSVKGSARLIIEEEKIVKKHFAKIPSTNEFIIQSAMNYGQNPGGCWDIPGANPTLSDGKNIQVYDFDDGFDRKYKFIESSIPGYYEIYISNNSNYRVNVDGGSAKDGANIELWSNNTNDRQNFKMKHLGGGRFKIYTTNETVLCLDNRKNNNDTNIHTWSDHDGNWVEWYLVDPITRTAFIPTEEKAIEVAERKLISDDNNGYINREVIVNSPKEIITSFLTITKNNFEAKAKLLVEAIYEITDFTDIIKYKKVNTPVDTKDFWTAYKINYSYAIMFENNLKDYYKTISENTYYSSSKPTTEIIDPTNEAQKLRLLKYEILTTSK